MSVPPRILTIGHAAEFPIPSPPDDPQIEEFRAAQSAQERWHLEAPALAVKLMRQVGGSGFELLEIDLDEVRALLDMAAAVMPDPAETDPPEPRSDFDEVPF